jgi:hypothetical protein
LSSSPSSNNNSTIQQQQQQQKQMLPPPLDEMMKKSACESNFSSCIGESRTIREIFGLPRANTCPVGCP